jgi:hypothetical protein
MTEKKIELIGLLEQAGLIRLPKTISASTLKKLEHLGLTDKEALRRRLFGTSYERGDADCWIGCERGLGGVAMAEMCWYLVYSPDE